MAKCTETLALESYWTQIQPLLRRSAQVGLPTASLFNILFILKSCYILINQTVLAMHDEYQGQNILEITKGKLKSYGKFFV